MISVLINNYNYAGYLEQAVESVIHQTYEDWELIIVDDGSKDCSAEIIKRYVEKYPKKIRGVFKENGGQASAVNAGFALAVSLHFWTAMITGSRKNWKRLRRLTGNMIT